MKKTILLSLLASASLLADGSDETLIASNYPMTSSANTEFVQVEKDDAVNNFNRRMIPYVKLGPNVITVAKTTFVSPNIGFGMRSESYTGAVDVSFSYSAAKAGDIYIYEAVFPKIVYHRFLSPYSSNSFYYGGGASWAEIKNPLHGVRFSGLMGNASVGYEMGRNSSIRQLIQIDLDQPIFAYRLGQGLPAPSVQASYSLGF